WRAADGRDGPRVDGEAEAASYGRAVDGPRADPRRAELRDHQAGARVGRRDARRRAERQCLALDRRPRLRALDGPARAGGQGGGPARGRRIAEGVSRPLGRRFVEYPRHDFLATFSMPRYVFSTVPRAATRAWMRRNSSSRCSSGRARLGEYVPSTAMYSSAVYSTFQRCRRESTSP